MIACRALELVEDPVVVRAHARERELAVGLDVHEDRVVRVDDGDVDTVLRHVVHVLGAVVVAGKDLVEAQTRQLLVVIGAPGGGFDPEAPLGRTAVEAPSVAAVGGAPHGRCAVAELRRHAVEHGGRFVDVAVGRDHPVGRCGGRGGSHASKIEVSYDRCKRSFESPGTVMAEGMRACAHKPSSSGASPRGRSSSRSRSTSPAPARCSCGSPRRASAGRTCTSSTAGR